MVTKHVLTTKIKLAIFVSLIFILESCSSLFKNIYGVQDPEVLSKNQIINIAKENGISEQNLFELDSNYLNYVYSKSKDVGNESIKYRTQPLQVMYYNDKNKLLSYHVNCLATGFPKLNWNSDKQFDTFVPKSQAPTNQFFPLEELVQYFNPISIKSLEMRNYNYVIIIFWNAFMEKQSKHLIKTVRNNIKLKNTEDKVKIIYVNNDNLFSNL